MINWKQHAKDYREFMQWDEENTTNFKTQKEAKEALRNDLEFIIGTNGTGDLYETELYYAKLLGMEI